jgi:hypothetical protein
MTARPTNVSISEIDTGLRSLDERTRWSAAIAAGELVESRPQDVWDLILQHGTSENEDVRTAVATCMLEHLLEHKFNQYFPLVESEIRAGNALLGKTLLLSWKMGAAKQPANAAQWDSLVKFIKDGRDAKLS